MKSLLVTAMVLSSFAHGAEKAEDKGRTGTQTPRVFGRPDVKAQPNPSNSDPAAGRSQQPFTPKVQPGVSPRTTSNPQAQTQNQPASVPKPGMTPKTTQNQPQAQTQPTIPAKATPKLTPQVQQQAPPAQPHVANRPQPATPVFQGPKAQVPPKQVNVRPVPPPAPSVIRPGQMHPTVIAQRFPHVRNFVDVRARAYRAAYHDRLMFLRTRYIAPTYFAPLRVAYRPWFRFGFYAYAYPVRPVVEFYTYFSNPCVAWFYNPYDAAFYQPFYGQYVTRYPDLGRGYARVGIFYPTEEFMALNVSISEMPVARQVHYRRAMVYLGDRLSVRYHAPIAQHQVIVNHYQMMPNNRAVVVEGFVDNEQTQMPFKAMVDLDNADNSSLFAVNSWKAEDRVTAEQSEDLYDLNDQITEYGGTIESEPQT